MVYKHEENQVDPRDKNLVTYSVASKRFIVEASSLKAAGVSLIYIYGGKKLILWLWSEKFQLSIPYVHHRQVKSPDGELIADVFIPRFDSIVTLREHNAHAASLGTELHILND